jgi:hypothetical protein
MLGIFKDHQRNSRTFQGLSRTCTVFKDFQGLENFKKKIPGLSRTCGNPVKINCLPISIPSGHSLLCNCLLNLCLLDFYEHNNETSRLSKRTHQRKPLGDEIIYIKGLAKKVCFFRVLSYNISFDIFLKISD